MKTKAVLISERIDRLESQLKRVQDKCIHKKATKEHKSDTGNWSPSDDCYWLSMECPTCLKRWTVDSNHSDYWKWNEVLERKNESRT